MWIISAPENLSSYHVIVKVGFKPVGDIMFDHNNEVVLQTHSVDERAQAGSELIQIPITTASVRPFWRCASKAKKKAAACDCYENQLPCRCNNQNALANTTSIVHDLKDHLISQTQNAIISIPLKHCP
jgi:hypothetical protein